MKGEIGAGPEPGGLFQAAVAEEADHHSLDPRDAEDLAQGKGRGRGLGGGVLPGFGAPERQAEKQHQGQGQLQVGHIPVTGRPTGGAR